MVAFNVTEGHQGNFYKGWLFFLSPPSCHKIVRSVRSGFTLQRGCLTTALGAWAARPPKSQAPVLERTPMLLSTTSLTQSQENHLSGGALPLTY